MGMFLSAAAFDGLKEVQTAEALRTISIWYLYIPIIIWAIMFVLAALYKLDNSYDKMIKELVEREGVQE